MLRIPRATVPQPIDGQAASSASQRAARQVGLVLLCGAWLVLGLFGRAPWKTEDAITFGIAWEMVQRGDWLVPYLAQEPALGASPLVPWLAALGITLFSPALAPPDAARIAAGLVLALLLILTGLAARQLNGRAMRWVPALLVVGTVGLFDRSHQLSAELALAPCVALAILALGFDDRRAYLGGLLLGIAVGLGFLAAGWIGPLWTLIPALALPACGERWRSRAHAARLAVAMAIALPLIAAWPLALAARSPALLEAWRAAQPLSDVVPGLGGFERIHPVWLARNIVWFAWPALPLLLWTLWIRARGFNGGLQQPGVVVPAVYSVWMLATLALLPDPRPIQLVPVIAPLALLASLEVDSMRREHSAALDWFGILTFGLTAMVLWGFWIDAYVNGMSTRVAILLRDSETGYGAPFYLPAFLAALFLTILWIILVRPARRSNRRAVLNWTAGMTLIWGLLATLWMPYLDARRTYAPLGESLGSAVPPRSCVVRRNLSDPQRALFYYFGGVVTVPEGSARAEDCNALLVQYGRLPDGTPQLPGHVVQWEGSRRGDVAERFVLYRKSGSPAP